MKKLDNLQNCILQLELGDLEVGSSSYETPKLYNRNCFWAVLGQLGILGLSCGLGLSGPNGPYEMHVGLKCCNWAFGVLVYNMFVRVTCCMCDMYV